MDIIIVAILDLEYVWNEVRKLREERVQLIFVFELICNEVMRKKTVLKFIEARHPSSMIQWRSILTISFSQNCNMFEAKSLPLKYNNQY